MGDPTQATPSASTNNSMPDTSQEPGHYGAGYGEQVPEDAPPQLGPATDGDRPPGARDQPADAGGSDAATATRGAGDDGEAVAFTAADVHARDPERMPTDAAPQSDQAALAFERS